MPVTVTYSWLRELVPGLDAPVRELMSRLTHVGLPVDELEETDGDWMLVLDVTANRPDCFGAVGVGREAAAAYGLSLRLPECSLEEEGEACESSFEIEVVEPALCPRYTGRIVRDVRAGEAPGWMGRRLEACGLRAISGVVDATNYVLLEWGQPLHAFDLDKLRGKIIVRRARAGEEIDLLDGTVKELGETELVIADLKGPVALAGVMGGARTQVDEGTRNVLIESAQFDPVSVRRSSRLHGVRTESSIRFERGVDPLGVELASRRACRLLAELSGGKVAPGLIDVWAERAERPRVQLRYGRLDAVVGHHIETGEARTILQRLGFEVASDEGEKLIVQVPSWRSDVGREIDLIEEVVRLHGYDRVGDRPRMTVSSSSHEKTYVARERVRELLCGMGYDEAVTESLLSREEWEAFRPWAEEQFVVTNPFRAGRDRVRSSLVPGLLFAWAENERAGQEEVRLFEVAQVCVRRGGEPETKELLAALRGDDFPSLKGDAEELLGRLGVEELEFRSEAFAGLDPACSAAVRAGGTEFGRCGLCSTELARTFDLRARPFLFELDLGGAVRKARLVRGFRPLPEYPGVARDVALVVDDSVAWSEVKRAALEGEDEWMSGPRFLSLYRGGSLPEGKKSLAFRVVYRSSERTLSDEEVAPVHEALVARLKEALGAVLRGEEG